MAAAMKRVYVAGAHTDVGKTFVARALAYLPMIGIDIRLSIAGAFERQPSGAREANGDRRWAVLQVAGPRTFGGSE